MLRRQIGVQLDVLDHLAAARSNEIKAAAIACAALFRRLHLQFVAIVDAIPLHFRCLALADVAEAVDLFAQRRRLGGARVQLGVDDGDVLVGGLKVEEVSVRLSAALQEEDKVAVVG